jgi:carbon storage regulator
LQIAKSIPIVRGSGPGKEGIVRMLVLTRKADQSIMIGDDIEVIVSSIEGNTVRIGIKAPRDVKVLRKETFEEVRLENIRAVQAAAKYTEGIGRMLPREKEAGKESTSFKGNSSEEREIE